MRVAICCRRNKMTRNATSRNEFRAPISPVTYCAEQHIFPVRYALTSEAHPPIWGQPLYSEHLPNLENYKFTLRTIYKGYIFIFWKGCHDVVCYRAKDKMFMNAFKNADEGKPTITIPHGVNTIFIRYLDIPDGGRPLDSSTLEKIAENLRSENYKYMQEVRLDESYGASMDCIATYVEEFRKRRTGYLSYLPSWGNNNDILKFSRRAVPHKDNSNFFRRWKASADRIRWQKATEFCKSTRLVALHDCIGNLLDCVSIQARSLKAISYFQQWHAPLLQSSLLTDTVAELRIRKAVENTEGLIHRNRLVKAAGYSVGSIPADAMADAASAQLNAQRHGYETKDLMDWVSPDVLRDAAFTQWKERTNHKLTGNYNADMLLWLEGIDIHYKKREEYIKKLDADIKELRRSMLPFARDWAAVLSCEKRFSLSETLCKVFKSDDQTNCPHSTLSTPLTTSRDEIFCMCQSGIAEVTEYFPILNELFEKNATFNKLWQEIMGKGGVPQGGFSAWLCSLIPYVEHRVSINGITDPLLTSFLDTSSKRLHCTSPTRDRGKIDPKEALRMAFVLTENGKTWRDVLPDLSDVAFSSKLFKTVKEGLLNPFKEYYEALLKEKERLSPAGQGDAGQAPASSKAAETTFQRPHVYEDAKTAESKAQPLRAHDTTIYLRYTSALDALINVCRALAVLTSVANLCAIAKELLRAHQQGEAYSALNGLCKALPSALTLIQEFRTVYLKQTVGVLFRGAVVAAGLAAAGVTFAEMWRKDQDGVAMAGRMTMELALVLIPFSGKVAALLGLHLLATGAVFVLLIAGGYTLFYVCKDSEEVEFLKNSLWNKKDDYAAYHAALEETDSQKFILDDDEVTSVGYMEMPSSPLWQDAHAVLKKHVSKFIYPNITMAMSQKYLYVNIKLLRMHRDQRIEGDLTTKVTLKAHMLDSARLYGSGNIDINTYYKNVDVSPVCEENFHAEEYLVCEMLFEKQAIESFASGNDGEAWLGLSCVASLFLGGIVLGEKTYYRDLLFLRYAATPEVEKRINDLLTRNPTTDASDPA